LPSDGEAVVARKLDDGLRGLGLRNQENLGLLLNLLGLKPPEGALQGLDGVLIGLRTRELLQQLAQARSRLTRLILVFEDLHWLDSASEDLLAKIVAINEPLQLLVLHMRRPEYHPPWMGQPHVAFLPMEPLSARETARIAEARLGVDHLPEALAKLIVAKAEGNALFAEEIATFLIERGIVRRSAAGLDFDLVAVAAALPESVQSLLSSRVDRLAPADRNLLQAAAVTGRRFDPDLVAVVGNASGNAEASFAAMEALDLIQRAEASNDYVFKHALVRDALYNGLLSASRSALHLKLAEELERRGGNRLTEIAEVLAHHYVETARKDKAFAYLAMAGDKSLDTYAISEAEQYYRKALAIFETQSNCAASQVVVLVIIRLMENADTENDNREVGNVARKFMPFVKGAGETPEVVIAYYHQWASLYQALELRAAHEVSVEALMLAERLGDGRARAYARGSLLMSRIALGLDALEVADRMKTELMEDSLRFGDNFIINWSHFFVAFDYWYRGLFKEAPESAMRLLASGGERKDPRAIGLGNVLLGYLCMFSDDPVAAEVHSRECERVAVTTYDRLQGALVKALSDVLLGRPREGLVKIEALDIEFERTGSLVARQDETRGVALALLGGISEGIQLIEREIVKFDSLGDHARAAWCRIILAEVYIQILSAKRKPQAPVLLKNFWTIIGAMIFGAKRARALLAEAAAVKMFSERGVIVARINFDLCVLSAIKGRGTKRKAISEKRESPPKVRVPTTCCKRSMPRSRNFSEAMRASRRSEADVATLSTNASQWNGSFGADSLPS
jgi:hypothetical protein